MTIRTRIVRRRRLAALVACALIATVLPLSAVAEYGIPAGSGAVITAGQPLLVRVAPGWDAAVSYEIADGSAVTVWDVAQAAPDGSLWYPVDGGFVPVDSVTSVAGLDGGFQLYQDAGTTEWTEPATEEWTEPAATASGWVDPTTGAWVDAAASQTGWVDPSTGEWVDPAATQQGWVDPNTGQWVDPAASQTGWVDPNTGEWVDPAATQTGWVDPTSGEWVAPAATETGWVDPTTGEWVNGVALAQDVPVDEPVAKTDEWVAPATDAPVEAAPVSNELVDPNATAPTDAAPATDGWVDPTTGEWVAPAPADAAPATDTWTEQAPVATDAAPVSDEWVEPAPVDSAASGDSWGEPIGTAYIAGTNGDGAACRMSAERGSDKVAVLDEGEPVEVRGEAIGEWQPVNCAGMGGYVNIAFIAWEPSVSTMELEQRRRDKNRGDKGNGGANAGNDGPSSASGEQIVNFAMQYVGYPYAYAGEGPYAFDCSGFTKFVIQNTLL